MNSISAKNKGSNLLALKLLFMVNPLHQCIKLTQLILNIMQYNILVILSH